MLRPLQSNFSTQTPPLALSRRPLHPVLSLFLLPFPYPFITSLLLILAFLPRCLILYLVLPQAILAIIHFISPLLPPIHMFSQPLSIKAKLPLCFRLHPVPYLDSQYRIYLLLHMNRTRHILTLFSQRFLRLVLFLPTLPALSRLLSHFPAIPPLHHHFMFRIPLSLRIHLSPCIHPYTLSFNLPPLMSNL